MLERLAIVIASFGLSGFFPVAPATFASALTALLLAFVFPLPSFAAYAGLFVLLLGVGVWSSARLERRLGHDPSAAVIDEVLGMCITMVGAPIQPLTLLLGFVFFRFFDIVKWPPGRAVERLPHGWGIMLDDVVAGVYAAIALRGLLWVWPQPRLEAWHAVVAALVAVLLWRWRKPLLRRYGKKRSRLSAAFSESEPPS